MGSESPVRIFIVEDHDVVRQGYVLILDLEPDLLVCGEAVTALDALDQLPDAAPDLMIVDVSLPGMSGIELLYRLADEYPGVRSLVVSGHDSDLYAERALEAGARGYVDKGVVADVLPEAIRAVAQGEIYLRTSAKHRPNP